MKNDAYWTRRMKILEDALLDTGYEYVQNLEIQFDRAIRDIESQMSAWYRRFAKNNNVTLAEARRLLTTQELKEFRWSVKEYIKYGQENAISQAWMQQLENASARVHVSRLDSLKLQLRQQSEALHGAQSEAAEKALAEIYRRGYYHTAFEIQKGLGVGWSLQGITDSEIKKVLSRPWTTDGRTFSDRIWSNKQSLIGSVNTQLTQMIMRGQAPDKAIQAIAGRFGVSKRQAGRLVMTESAAFSSMAQKDCFTELDVEEYRIIATLDSMTCELCGELDNTAHKMSEYVVGATAPPFHPWCRCCTAPYFADMENGTRVARDNEGKYYEVPRDMTYKEWYTNSVKTTENSKEQFTNEEKDDIITVNPTKDIVEKAIGSKQSVPIDIADAIKGANPNYSAGYGYRVNCQRCVQAYELRRRGYDVIAKPKPSANNIIAWGSECFIPSGQSAYSAFTMRQTEAAIKRELATMPDGARYTIYVKWKGRNSGAHVFIAEKKAGIVQYLDPQSGNLDASGYFAQGRPGMFGFFRMDDKVLTTDEAIIKATVEVK